MQDVKIIVTHIRKIVRVIRKNLLETWSSRSLDFEFIPRCKFSYAWKHKCLKSFYSVLGTRYSQFKNFYVPSHG